MDCTSQSEPLRMPKNRRNRSRNRGGNERNKMRMDDVRGSIGNGGRRDEPRPPRNRRLSNSPRRRELGDAMEKARRDGGHSAFWTKKLLEAEAKVPDRWRHSGFGEMYRDELRNSRSRSSSSSSCSTRSRSPVERPKSPAIHRPRTPNKASKDKSQKTRPRSPPSPPSRQSNSRERTRGRPRTPTHRQRIAHRKAQHSSRSSYSSSGSESSCSDDDCSICTPKHRKQNRSTRSPPSPSPPPPPPKKVIKRVVSNNKKTGRKTPPEPVVAATRKKRRVAERRPKSPPHPRPPARSSSGSSSSSSDSEGSSGEINETPKMTLSERFGKMAQWSVDRREYDSVSMRITKDSAAQDMKVIIEDGTEIEFPVSRQERVAARRESPDRDYAFHYEKRRYFFERTFTEERPPGQDAPVNWSDPLIRYSYYRRKGLLWETDVSFDEYFKWESWWQRYQEWLEVERACYGEDAALDNARRERERDWESYRSSNLGRSPLDRGILFLPKNEPWLTSRRAAGGGIGRNVINKGAEGFVTRKYLRT